MKINLVDRNSFLQRLDAILRSNMYSHFSESLSGMATIRMIICISNVVLALTDKKVLMASRIGSSKRMK